MRTRNTTYTAIATAVAARTSCQKEETIPIAEEIILGKYEAKQAAVQRRTNPAAHVWLLFGAAENSKKKKKTHGHIIIMPAIGAPDFSEE